MLNIDTTDGDKPKISLGIKQLIPDPWDRIPFDYPVARSLPPRFRRSSTSAPSWNWRRCRRPGARLRISEERVDDPRGVPQARSGDQRRIISLDPNERKIGLSVKAAQRAAEISMAQGL